MMVTDLFLHIIILYRKKGCFKVFYLTEDYLSSAEDTTCSLHNDLTTRFLPTMFGNY